MTSPRSLIACCLTCAVVLGAPGLAWPEVTVTAPAAGSESVSGTSDAPTLVGTHTWVVTSDEADGASLTLQADSFVHVVETNKKASIRLNLTKTSGAAWSVGIGQSISTDTTPAQVSASSTGTGDAAFSVDVTFVPGNVSVLPSGNYSTSIVGTIAANP